MTRRTQSGLLALLFLMVIFFALPMAVAHAEEQRVFDQAGLFEGSDRETMESRAAALRDSLQMDVVIVTTDDAQGKDSQNYADDFYDNGGFGAGEDKSGVLYLIDMDNRQVYISTCGSAIAMLDNAEVERLLSGSLPYLQTQDYGGAPLYFLGEMEQLAAISGGDAAGIEADSAVEGPRVFDQAGLFTEEQVSNLEQACTALRNSCKLDLVVVTTDNAEGKTSQDYADDFYDAGGFGVGTDKSGALFLIDMDNRQAYISTCGSAIGLLSDSMIQSILDEAVACLQQQDYGGAAQVFLDRVESIVQNAPSQEQVPAQDGLFYVQDQAGILSNVNRNSLEIQAERLRKNLDIDVGMAIVDGLGGKSLSQYAADFYRTMGYGAGAEKSGALFLLDMDSQKAYIYINGRAGQYLTAQNTDTIMADAVRAFNRRNYADGMQSFLENIQRAAKNLEKTGSVVPPPRASQPGYIITVLLISLAVGGICVLVVHKRYRPGTIKPGYPYRDTGKLNLRKQDDQLVDSHVTTRYIPPPPPPPSSSGGGFSSGGFGGGSSTHMSSGGTTHGGGGMSFSSRSTRSRSSSISRSTRSTSRSSSRSSSGGSRHGGGGRGF